MTGRDLYFSLTQTGHAVKADHPAPGGLWISNADTLTQEQRALIKEFRGALLIQARHAASADTMQAETAESPYRVATIADLRTAREKALAASSARSAEPDTSFPYGANNPDAPDGPAAALLAELRAVGVVLTINPADRGGLLASGKALTDAQRAAVKANKVMLLKELEVEARAEEEAKRPAPFRGGVDADGDAAGAVLVEPNGVSGDRGGSVERPPVATADGAESPGSEGATGANQPTGAGATGSSDGAGSGAATAAPPASGRSWRGWVRENEEAWILVADNLPDAGSCWATVLAHPVSGDNVERLVTWRTTKPK